MLCSILYAYSVYDKYIYIYIYIYILRIINIYVMRYSCCCCKYVIIVLIILLSY